jgi:hypothetical protein
VVATVIDAACCGSTAVASCRGSATVAPAVPLRPPATAP